jgi:ribosomal protein L33
MASKDAVKFSLRSTYQYVNSLGKKVTSATEYMVKRNPRKQPEKLEFRKYDPVAKKHVQFVEKKIKK